MRVGVRVEVQLFPELVNVFFIVNTRDISEDCINLQYLYLLNLTFSDLSQDFQGKAAPDSGCDLHVFLILSIDTRMLVLMMHGKFPKYR